MSEQILKLEADVPQTSRAREALVKRLIDVVALPASRVPPQDRSMAGDILLEMLMSASPEDVALCARRLADKSEAPKRVLRFLAATPIDVSRDLLERNTGLDDSDLVSVASMATTEHRLVIAGRRSIGPLLSETLVDFAEPEVVGALLANQDVAMSDVCVDAILTLSRSHIELCPALMSRPELTPAHAMAMFWWADGATRLSIVQRQAAERIDLIEACSDVFAMMAEEGWKDPVARKALQLIERRQRNRTAVERSEFVNLEHAVEVAAKKGLTSELAQEIGYLAGLKPITIAKILSDKGGEGIAVLCKATGLKLAYLKLIWQSLRRPVEDGDGEPNAHFRQVLYCYQIMTVAKAQTILRYWNWSLSSAYSPSAGLAEAEEDEVQSVARRTANLVFGS